MEGVHGGPNNPAALQEMVLEPRFQLGYKAIGHHSNGLLHCGVGPVMMAITAQQFIVGRHLWHQKSQLRAKTLRILNAKKKKLRFALFPLYFGVGEHALTVTAISRFFAFE